MEDGCEIIDYDCFEDYKTYEDSYLMTIGEYADEDSDADNTSLSSEIRDITILN